MPSSDLSSDFSPAIFVLIAVVVTLSALFLAGGFFFAGLVGVCRRCDSESAGRHNRAHNQREDETDN